jgi:HK97 family phage portal protein
MSLLTRLIAAFRKDGGAVGSELRDAYGEWGLSESGIPVNSWTAMQHGPVMACVSILAEDVAKIPLGVFRRTADGGQVAAKDHYLHRLLRHPNGWQTAFEFKEMMQAALVLRGNAYAVTVRDGRGTPLYLVPVHPDRVTLFEAPDGDWFYLVTRSGLHDMAVLREQPILIPSYDVLHIRWLAQWNSLLGSSRITLARQPVGLAMGLEEHQARFTGQGTRVSGVLSTEQKLSKDVRDMLASEWQKAKGGPRNAGATAVLEQGVKWQALGMTMVDAEFMASREYQLREIARVFNLPPYKLGIQGADSGPSLVQQGQEYLNGPISGYCERWKAKLEKFFDLDGDEIFVDWDYGHFLKADIGTRYVAFRQAVGGPWMTPNEARRSDGLPSVADGDTVMQATNMAPLGWVPPDRGTAGQGSNQTGSPATGGDGDPERNPANDAAPGT